MELVALLSSGQGTWAQVAGLVKRGDWDKILLVGDGFAESFTTEKESEFIKVDFRKPILELKEDLMKKLKGKIKGTEVALSIASGNGKEHMALISSILSLPAGVRFAVLTREGVVLL